MRIDVVYGKLGLVAIYKDGVLSATHDKHTKGNGDLARDILTLEESGAEIIESKGSFSRFHEIPTEHSIGVAVEVKKSDPVPEPEVKPEPVTLEALEKEVKIIAGEPVKRGPGRPPKVKNV